MEVQYFWKNKSWKSDTHVALICQFLRVSNIRTFSQFWWSLVNHLLLCKTTFVFVLMCLFCYIRVKDSRQGYMFNNRLSTAHVFPVNFTRVPCQLHTCSLSSSEQLRKCKITRTLNTEYSQQEYFNHKWFIKQVCHCCKGIMSSWSFNGWFSK